jgi:hypothetical protein
MPPEILALRRAGARAQLGLMEGHVRPATRLLPRSMRGYESGSRPSKHGRVLSVLEANTHRCWSAICQATRRYGPFVLCLGMAECLCCMSNERGKLACFIPSSEV